VNEFQLPSEEQIESFLRGESDLEFRSLTDINVDGARYVTRKIRDEDVEFLAVKGIATTAAIDDNGVEVTPDALKSLPADFKRRNTLLFNHNPDMPIGTIGGAKFVNGANGRKLSRPARVDVNPVLIDTEARLPTGQRVVTAVERGTLSKFSFAWSTRDGIIVFGPHKGVDKEEIEALGLDAEESFAFRIGSDNSPQIRVNSLVGVELSIVSVPADAAAEFGARFQRHLDTAIERYADKRNGIFVPESYQEDPDGRILVPISGFRALAASEEPEEREVETEVEETEGEVLEVERNVINIVIDSDVLAERVLQTIEERVLARLEPATPEDDGERDISDPPDTLKGVVAFRETGVIDRIWSAADVEARVANWARGEDEELDLENGEHQARYEQAYIGYRKNGGSSSEYFLLHHDVVDGELVSNLRGVRDAAKRFAETDFGEDSEDRIDAATRHLAAEYTAHGEEVPEALREDSTEDEEE
jgi:hypothetical protein